MDKYLVKLTPLEEYSFGTDQGYSYPEEKNMGKVSYFAKSSFLPSMTTVLGMLRYVVLMDNNCIKTDFNYDANEKEHIDTLVGDESFNFYSESEQDFGSINSISPIFLMENDRIYIKNPYNNTPSQEKGYTPIGLEEKEIVTQDGPIRLPVVGAYDPKEGYAQGYICLNDKCIVDDIFSTRIISHNRKNDKKEDGKDGFFKREVVKMKEGFSFAMFVEAEKLPEKTICYMGAKKSAFLFEAKADKREFVRLVEDSFKDSDGGCYYALSDIYTDNPLIYNSFCIIAKHYQRNLTTKYSEGKGRLIKSNSRINLIESGSVFYENITEQVINKNAKKIGYNVIVRLGGQ